MCCSLGKVSILSVLGKEYCAKQFLRQGLDIFFIFYFPRSQMSVFKAMRVAVTCFCCGRILILVYNNRGSIA